MSDILWHLFRYLHHHERSQRSSYFRYRPWLPKPLGSLKAVAFMTHVNDRALVETLARQGPLRPEDFESRRIQRTLHVWNRTLPQDPRFFQLALKQWALWKRCSKLSVESFLHSEEAHRWARKRQRLTRPALFELDCHYKKSKSSSLRYEVSAREILRKYPFLSLKSLQLAHLKNAQAIWERFPQRELYLKRFYQNVLKPTIDELNQTRAKASSSQDLA